LFRSGSGLVPGRFRVVPGWFLSICGTSHPLVFEKCLGNKSTANRRAVGSILSISGTFAPPFAPAEGFGALFRPTAPHVSEFIHGEHRSLEGPLRILGWGFFGTVLACNEEVHWPFVLVHLCELAQTVKKVRMTEIQRAVKVAPGPLQATITDWLRKGPAGPCLTERLFMMAITRQGAHFHSVLFSQIAGRSSFAHSLFRFCPVLCFTGVRTTASPRV
jgi:hypothetical protein